MKRSLYILLAAACVVSPLYAYPLKADDWEVVSAQGDSIADADASIKFVKD